MSYHDRLNQLYQGEQDGRPDNRQWGTTSSSPQITSEATRPQPSLMNANEPVSSSSDTTASSLRSRRTEHQQQNTARRDTEHQSSVEYTLKTMVPSKWYVPKNNKHVRREKHALRLVGQMLPGDETSVLVVTNKHIPMEDLHTIALKRRTTRQEVHGESQDVQHDMPSTNAVNVYYFEVTVQKGITWVGLVPSQALKGPVTVGRFPGDCVASIGMSFDGQLLISAQRKQVSTTGKENSRSSEERNTIGCGLEVGEAGTPTKVFFTKNGEMFVAPMEVPEVDTRHYRYFPAVGIAGAGGDVFANFGLSYPFRWKGSDRYILFSPSEVVPARNSPVRATGTTVGGTNDPSPSSFSPSSAGNREQKSHGSQGPPNVAARIEESRRSEVAFSPDLTGAPSIASRHVPSIPVNRPPAHFDDDTPGFKRPDWEKGAFERPMDEVETNGGSFNMSQGSTFQMYQFPHQSHASFGDTYQPRQPDNGLDEKLPSRPSGINVGPRNSSLNSSASSSHRSRQTSIEGMHNETRVSVSSPPKYGRQSDKTFCLDEDDPEQELPSFLISPFAKKPSITPPTPDEAYNGRVGAHYVNDPAMGRVGAHWVENKSAVLMDPQEIIDATECARDLQRCCESDDADPSFVEGLLDICRSKQETVRKTLEEGLIKFDDPSMVKPLHELMTLNDSLLDAIDFAECRLKTNMKPAPGPHPNPYPDSHSPIHVATGSLEIDILVKRKDVFSLICMLRAQGDKRLDAALALMR